MSRSDSFVLPRAPLAAAGCSADADAERRRRRRSRRPSRSSTAAAVASSRSRASSASAARSRPQEDRRRRRRDRRAASSPRRSSAAAASSAGADLIRIAAAEVDAQAREAEANAAQIEARLGIAGGGRFDVERVPEVANATRRARAGAQADFERARRRSIDGKLLSQAEFDQRRAQIEAGRAAVRRRAATAPSSSTRRCWPRARASTLAQQGARRHRRARAVRRRRRRALRLGRRLRHPRHQGRVGDAHRPAARRADGARAVRLGGRRRAAR